MEGEYCEESQFQLAVDETTAFYNQKIYDINASNPKVSKSNKTEALELDWSNIDSLVEKLGQVRFGRRSISLQPVRNSKSSGQARSLTAQRLKPPSKPLPTTPKGDPKRGISADSIDTNEELLIHSDSVVLRSNEGPSSNKGLISSDSILLDRTSPSKGQTLTYSINLNDRELKALKRLNTRGTVSIKSGGLLDSLKKKVGNTNTFSPATGQSLLKKMADEWERDAKRLAEEWIAKTIYPTKWDQNAVSDPDTVLSLIDVTCINHGFNLEFGKIGIDVEDCCELEEKEKEIPYYKRFLADKEHDNIVGEDRIHGPIIISVESKQKGGIEQRILKSIIRTKKGDRRMAIVGKTDRPFPDTVDGKIKVLKELVPEYAEVKFSGIQIDHSDMVSSLLAFEQTQLTPNYKFGILLMKKGQQEENEFFNNVETTSQFDEFLNCIGERVTLKGFQKFSGGLDTKSDTTGVESVYTSHKGYEIMFHVSTLLPYFPKDLQQVERKRHLGNDVVVVIFKESPDDSFPAHLISSQFNHVFVVVQPEDKNMYRVAFANKPGVRPYGPLMPSPALFEKGPKFKEFFLTKLINAERAAMHAPDFRHRLAKTREMMLRHLIMDVGMKKEKNGMMKRFGTVRKIGDRIRQSAKITTPFDERGESEETKVEEETARTIMITLS